MDSLSAAISKIAEIQDASSFFSWPQILSIILGAGGLLVSVIAFRKTTRWNNHIRKTEINKYWMELTKSRLLIWETLDEIYEIWKQEIKWGPNSPLNHVWLESLGLLLEKAGLPPNREIKDNWEAFFHRIENAGNDLAAKWIYQFCKRIYPDKKNQTSILITYFANKANPDLKRYIEFYKARAELTVALNGWAETDDKFFRYLCKKFNKDMAILSILYWLELALYGHIGSYRWSDRTDFYKLAREISKSGPFTA